MPAMGTRSGPCAFRRERMSGWAGTGLWASVHSEEFWNAWEGAGNVTPRNANDWGV